MKEFYRKHKVKIVMFTPILLAVAFFFYSTISGLITVHTTQIPENFEDVNVEINDYQIQQIDERTNQIKWILKAKTAEAASEDGFAKISNPQLIYYELGRAKFTITSEYAILDQKSQEVELNDNVVLKTSDGKYTIRAGTMFFKEASDFIEFQKNWSIQNDSGYQINGLIGSVSKNFKTIISRNNARLNKGSLDIYGQEIKLLSDSKEPVIATNQALLKISESQKLYAHEIRIAENGFVRASGNVNVKTPEIDCFSNNLVIEPKPDKNPKIAIFTGNPHVIQSGNSIYSDRIVYDFDTKQASMEGRVHSGV